MSMYLLPAPKNVDELDFGNHFLLDRNTKAYVNNLELLSELDIMLSSIDAAAPVSSIIDIGNGTTWAPRDDR